MWGFEPAESAILVKDFFVEEKLKDILIPGIGYGRNAKIFLENGINVTGIEIDEPIKFDNKIPPMKFTVIKCQNIDFH